MPKSFIGGFALVLVVTMLLFAQGLKNGFVSDDWCFLYEVEQATSFRDLLPKMGFQQGWFVRPTQWIATWILERIFGLDPFPFHVLSFFLHLVNGVLVYALTFALFSMTGIQVRMNRWLALGTMTMFLLNQRHHEAVFWFSSINELLSTCFSLGSLILLWQAFHATRWPRIVLLMGTFIFSVLAVLSKESAITLPAKQALLLGLLWASELRARGGFRPPWPVLFTVGLLALLAGAWLFSYIRLSSVMPETTVSRGGLGIMRTGLIVWILRAIQYLNHSYPGLGFISRNIVFLRVEAVILIFYCIASATRRDYVVLFVILCLFATVLPYAGIVSKQALELRIPLLELGAGGDRFVYSISAYSSMLFVFVPMRIVGLFGYRLTSRQNTRLAVSLLSLVCAYSVANGCALVNSLRAWNQAASLVEQITSKAVVEAAGLHPGSRLCLTHLPDSVGGPPGAYVFRNCATQALYLKGLDKDILLQVTVQSPIPTIAEPLPHLSDCSILFTYDDNLQTIVATIP